MAEWKETEVSEFLKERVGRYRPNDRILSKLKRLDKIDFSGRMHFSNKSSKTDMIIAKKGDLVISGINVAKGALAVYDGDDDITATIHYSSYQFDNEKINVEYFKRFLKSPKFIQLLKEQVKGGIKTEIKPKHLLPLKIELPDIDTQKSIVKYFQKTENEINNINDEINNQQSLLKQLRQAILQEAVEGKLTAEWRKQNPDLISGENHAARLLEKIKAEKERLAKEGKIKKQKPLPPISDDEKPFALPEGWAWCRLGEMILMNYGKGLTKKQTKPIGKYPVYGSNGIVGYFDECLTEKKAIIIGRKGSAGAIQIAEKGSWTTDVAYFIEEIEDLNFYYLINLLRSLELQKLGKGIKPGLNRDEFYKLLIPLPPIYEQQAIVEKVDLLMAKIDALEEQVKSRKTQVEQLMQAVLREAFNGG